MSEHIERRRSVIAEQIDKLGMRMVRRSMRNERTMVDEPDRARRIMLLDFALFVIVLAASSAYGWATGWLHSVAVTIVSLFIGFNALRATRRMHAYRNGWLDGRAALIDSLAEAQRRGMNAHDWCELEITRDLGVMGVPLVPRQREGPELSDDERRHDNGGEHDRL